MILLLWTLLVCVTSYATDVFVLKISILYSLTLLVWYCILYLFCKDVLQNRSLVCRCIFTVSLSLLCCLAFKASPCCKCGNAGCQTGTHRSKLGATKLDRADQWPLNAKQQAQYFVSVQCTMSPMIIPWKARSTISQNMSLFSVQCHH